MSTINFMKFMEGYKTYSGAFIMLVSGVVGMLGMQDIISSEEISTFIAGIGGVIGFIITIYGRYTAKVDLQPKTK